MKCKKIKGLLAGGYIDGELSEETERMVRGHLESCARCREYLRALRVGAVAPFSDALRVPVPDGTWPNIEKAVRETARETEESLRVRSGDGFARYRRPVWAAAMAVIIMVTALWTYERWRSTQRVNSYIEEQVEFLSSLRQSDNGDVSTDDDSFESVVERYLL
jgi:anti-sigma factor RsiW